MQNICIAMFTRSRDEVLLLTQRKVFVKHKCKNKRKTM